MCLPPSFLSLRHTGKFYIRLDYHRDVSHVSKVALKNNNFSILKKCKVTLELRDLEKTTIKLVPQTIVMESGKELSQYTIVKWSLEYRSSRLYPSVNSRTFE